MIPVAWYEKFQVSKKQADDLRKAGAALWNMAEPGFREKATHDYLSGLFEILGFSVRPFEGIPGFIASFPEKSGAPSNTSSDQSGSSGIPAASQKTAPTSGTENAADSEGRIALISDMDGLPNPEDSTGTYIHSCGHHMQMAALYGAARLLKDAASGALRHMDFIAVPAEEYIDLEYRETLRSAGVVSRLSGKQELIERGYFKGYRQVVSTHAAGFQEPLFISSVRSMGGFRAMRFIFRGKAAHAGAAPHKGINAQNAASLFLQACAFLREGFRNEDYIRIHPVLSYPPDQSVNIVPALVRADTYVRAAAIEAIDETAGKLKDAAKGAAAALGASVEIEEIPGYAPFKANLDMHEILRTVTEEMELPFIDEDYSAASSDVGDLSQMIPTIMLGLPGVNGLFHNPGFRVTDEDAAYVLPSAVLVRYLEALTGC